MHHPRLFASEAATEGDPRKDHWPDQRPLLAEGKVSRTCLLAPVRAGQLHDMVLRSDSFASSTADSAFSSILAAAQPPAVAEGMGTLHTDTPFAHTGDPIGPSPTSLDTEVVTVSHQPKHRDRDVSI